MSTTPFATPATASGVDWNELNGALLLIEPLSVEVGVRTSLGDRDAVRADVTVLDGPEAGAEHADVLVFPKVLQGQIRSRIGQKVLGRLGQGVAKAGQSPPWMLSEATEADQKIGVSWLTHKAATSVAAPAAPNAWEKAAAGADKPPF